MDRHWTYDVESDAFVADDTSVERCAGQLARLLANIDVGAERSATIITVFYGGGSGDFPAESELGNGLFQFTRGGVMGRKTVVGKLLSLEQYILAYAKVYRRQERLGAAG